MRYLSEGNYEEAIIAFTAAIEIDAKRPEGYIGRGDAYTLSGDTEDNLSAAQAEGRLAEYGPNRLREAPKAVMCDVPVSVYAASLGDHIARWHLLLSLAYACWCNSAGTHAAALRMALCICEIMEWAEEAGVDMGIILDIKHEYNKTRPYRHGGKAL